ncbi:c-type cytochrome biogenesis protein CcmI [Sulfuriflexus mobilis]|uniref:c-type cytochrome biogenesis protein CcmI n=1 Tax=Sulfuriflexus mobilis TaxID=1811807 RepID=UPI000F820D34|nr:c-type cytochrome biogenesis protein CcmI [Sulfuriflexus mobilis]
MISFWMIAITLMVVVLAWLAPALLGRRHAPEGDRNEQNVRIARERLRELEADLHSGAITAVQFDQSRNELELALLTDVSVDSAQVVNKQTGSEPWAIALLILIVPILSASLYLYLGHPAALRGDSASDKAQLPADHVAAVGTDELPSMQDMLARLQTRLEQQPDDAEGWFTLGRTYMTMGRYPEAAEALETVHRLVGDHPSVLLSYANALVMSNGGRLTGKAFALIQKVLQATPDDPTALWLAGIGYEEQGDYAAAVHHWKRLQALLVDEDVESQTEVRQRIAGAEEKRDRKLNVGGAAPAARLTVRVSLDPALQDRVRPTDTLFVFARAMQGSPMPLAVVRKQVRDLPLEVTLDDAMAMMPSMRLSRFSEVLVGARISKSGNAMVQSGDLSGEIGAVSITRTSPVLVVINAEQP